MIWKPKYELGDALLDAQHRELFSRVDAFLQALRTKDAWEGRVERVNETLAFMQAYVAEHFRDEEAYQQRAGYPGLEEHRSIHREMAAYVAQAARQYATEGFSETLMMQFGGRLLAWLINHVAAEDQKIAAFVREQARAGALLRPFLEAAQNVFELMLDIAGVTSAPASGEDAGDALCVSIGVTGDAAGEAVYCFPLRTSLSIVRLMSGMETGEMDAFVASAIGEIASIISGNAMTLLAGEGLSCRTLPPRIVPPQARPGMASARIVTPAGDLKILLAIAR